MSPMLPLSLTAAVAILAPCAAAQEPSGTPPWTFRTSVLVTGSSEVSNEDYKTLSSIGLGAGVRRRINGFLAAEFNLSVTSREVIIEEPGGGEVTQASIEVSQGSMETIPLNLLLQVRPSVGGHVHPYAGAGVNLTPVWEKTGALDSDDIAPTVGLALQLGVDFDLSPGVLINVDLGWNTAEPDIEANDVRVTTITINPFTISAGVGFRF